MLREIGSSKLESPGLKRDGKIYYYSLWFYAINCFISGLDPDKQPSIGNVLMLRHENRPIDVLAVIQPLAHSPPASFVLLVVNLSGVGELRL